MKYLYIFLVLIFFQSCVECYSQKEYTLLKSNYDENINIEGIENLSTIGDTLSFRVNKEILTQKLFLKDIKLFYNDKYLGELNININLSQRDEIDIITPDGTILKRISLRKGLIKILNDKKIEKMLQIGTDYMSKEVRFEYEFIIDGEVRKEVIHYNISKEEKGCHLWIPSR